MRLERLLAIASLLLVGGGVAHAQTPAPQQAPYFTGVVSRVENHMQLTTPDGTVWTLGASGSNFHDWWAGDTMGFAGQTITVQGFVDPVKRTIMVDSFAPGAGHDFLCGRVQQNGAALRVQGLGTVMVADSSMKATLSSWNEAGLILHGTTTWNGTAWTFTPSSKDVWMLVILGNAVAGTPVSYNAQTPAGVTTLIGTLTNVENLANRRFVHGLFADATTTGFPGATQAHRFVADASSGFIEHPVKYQTQSDGNGLNIDRNATTAAPLPPPAAAPAPANAGVAH